MNSILNLFFLIIFSVFLFYWFQNIIKKKERYLYVPYSSVSDIPDSDELEQEDTEEISDVPDEINDLLQVNENLESVFSENIIQRNSIFENWENYL